MKTKVFSCVATADIRNVHRGDILFMGTFEECHGHARHVACYGTRSVVRLAKPHEVALWEEITGADVKASMVVRIRYQNGNTEDVTVATRADALALRSELTGRAVCTF